MEFDLESALRKLERSSIALGIQAEPGAGRLGGVPDVPPDFVWPTFETDVLEDDLVRPRPLSFLVQLDCAALAEQDEEGLLPREGLLSFFYEMGSQRWGFDPKDAGCARVYWFPDKSVLRPAVLPEDLDEEFCLPPLHLKAWSEKTYPDFQDFALAYPHEVHPGFWKNRDRSWAQFCDEFDRLSESLRGEDSGHRLLGWPRIIQNNMTQECELIDRGYYLGSFREGIPEEIREKARSTSLEEWQLLLQLDSFMEGDVSLNFGDCGSIYFYIRRHELAERSFDQIWLILQSY